MQETLATAERRWRRIAFLLALFVMAIAGVTRRFHRVEVTGASMAPGLLPGDRLLMRRCGPRTALNVGAIVGFEDPRPHRGQLMIKRVASIDGDQVFVLGDNAQASSDSRIFGPVKRSDIQWIVVRRYARATVTP